ncbi:MULTISPECIES: dihydrofolate reductase family protein [Actinomycetes]|uniref:Bacterial bifunctional deaminase-reductase C-terminal domain-containing protein n=2 Tax=Actinomycetes TaxID=1760 RepID=A0ABP6LP82_9MICC
MQSPSETTSSTRKIFAFLFMSLDGYVEGPDGELDWNLTDEEFFTWNIRQSREIGALLLGRRTFDHFAEFWTTPSAAAAMPEVWTFMNTVPKTVVTGRDAPPQDWDGTRVVDGDDLAGVVGTLRDETGGDVAVLGSPTLTCALLEQGLIDELRLLVHPVLLGGGRRLTDALRHRVLLDAGPTTVFRSGNTLLTYRPRTLERTP